VDIHVKVWSQKILEWVPQTVSIGDDIAMILEKSMPCTFFAHVNPVFGGLAQLILSGKITKEFVSTMTKQYPDDIIATVQKAVFIYKDKRNKSIYEQFADY